MVAGIALMVWGSVELFIVDKTLRPRLVGGPVKLPFLPTFFGLVGGSRPWASWACSSARC